MPTILITRPRNKATDFAEALQAVGAEPVFLPCIEIRPVADTTVLDRALSRLNCYDWLVLTSTSAVDTVLERLEQLSLSLPFGREVDGVGPRLAAVGPKTAASLGEHGIHPDFVPDEYIAEAILPGLGNLRGRWVLLPTADIAHDTLPKAVQAAGGVAHVITAYHTVPAAPEPQGLAALWEGVDVITFTSGSTVRNFATLAQNAGLDPFDLPGSPHIACIGPKTARAAQEAGFIVDIVAEEYTMDGLVEAIRNQSSRN